MPDDELRKIIAELKQQQEELLGAVRTSKKKDFWEKIQALSPLMSGVLISSVGLYCTYSYNQQALKLQTIQTVEKFIPHLLGNEVSKKAAILAMSSLGNTEIATKFATFFASEGTVSALKSIAQQDNKQDKTVVDKALAEALDAMAEQYREQNKFVQAEEAYKQALQIKEKSFGDDPEVAGKMQKLAQFYIAQGNYEAAEPLLKRTLAMRERLFGVENPLVGESLKDLSEFYKLQGNTQQAELYLKRAIAVAPKIKQEGSSQANSIEASKAQDTTGTPDPVQQPEPKSAPEAEDPQAVKS